MNLIPDSMKAQAYKVSKLLTHVAPILVCLLCGLPGSFSTAAEPECKDVFTPESDLGSQGGWQGFLNKIFTEDSKMDGMSGNIPQITIKTSTVVVPRETLESGAITDSRLTKLHELFPDETATHHRRWDLQKKFESIKDEFEYLYSRTLMGKRYESFEVVRSRKSGAIFSVKLPDYTHTTDYGHDAALVGYLKSQELVAQSNITSPQLDYFFDRLKRTTRASGPTAVGKILYWSRKPEGDDHGKVEKHFLSYVDLKDPFRKHARFLTKQTVVKEHFILEIVDTHVSEMTYEDSKAADSHAGQAKQSEWITELMRNIFRDYKQRRGWSDSFLRQLYQKVLTTADHTRYVTVRAKRPDGSAGEILATLGLNRAAYGTIRYFNLVSQKWEIQTGPYGSSYEEDYGRPFDERDGEQNRIDRWQGKVPSLGMEGYLHLILPRPSVVEEIWKPKGEEGFSNSFYNNEVQKYSEMQPDPQQPIYLGSGEIYEPVKFWVNPNSDLRGEAYSELIAAILKSIFPDHRGVPYGLGAQYLYTYNPRDGVLLYRGQGFQPLAQFPPQTKDGTKWFSLGSSPASLAQKFHATSSGSADHEAEQFVHRLRETVDQLLQREKFKNE